MQPRLDHQLGLGRDRDVDGPAGHDPHRLAEQVSGVLEFVVAQAEVEAGGQLDRGVGADHHRDVERLAALAGDPGQRHQVVVGRDADQAPVAAQRLDPGVGGVAIAGARLVGADHACGEVRAGVAFEEARDRQQREQVVMVGREQDLLLAGSLGDRFRSHRHGHRAGDPWGQGLHLAPDRGGDPLPRVQQVPEDRESARRRGRRPDQRSVVPECEGGGKLVLQVDRARQVHHLAALGERFDVAATGLVHQAALPGMNSPGRVPSTISTLRHTA